MSPTEAVFAASALALGIALFIGTLSYPFASSYFPRALAIVISALAVIYGARLVAQSSGAPTGGSDEGAVDGASARLRSAAIVLLAAPAYTAAIALTGFRVATLAFLIIMTTALGLRSPLTIGLVAVFVTVGLDVVFFQLLGVPRPNVALF